MVLLLFLENTSKEILSLFPPLVLKDNHDSFMPRYKFISRILFNTSVILLTRRGAYSYIYYSTMSCHNRIGYSHKSGTGHHSKKRRCSVSLTTDKDAVIIESAFINKNDEICSTSFETKGMR